jgi:UDP-N-acetylglucosamine diphosphorylase/glucosamine-1-phosphate N-acetyltransferase
LNTDTALILFDDARAREWVPFSATRPVGELLFGCMLLRERAERSLGLPCAGHLVGDRLAGFREEGSPPVVLPEDVDAGRTRVLLSSRVVPEVASLDFDDVTEATALVVGDEPVGWILPPGAPLPPTEALEEPASEAWKGPVTVLEGALLGWPWELVAENADRVARDVSWLHHGQDSFLLTDVHVIGKGGVILGNGTVVEPGVVLDVRDGPIHLGPGVRVESPARLTGPIHVDRGSTVFGGSLEHVSVGPVCKVRGEIEASVFLGYGNKAHDGFLGHAYVGRWVNLGALTTNSDLKNSYSSVRIPVAPDREVDTGLLKVGCLIGDHVKTGIGTLFNTGTVVGVGSNVFGGGVLPRWVPPFSWGTGEGLVEYRLEKFLEVAGKAMARRSIELDEGTRNLLGRAWEESRAQRHRD